MTLKYPAWRASAALALALAALAIPAASSGQSAVVKSDGGEYCCADDQNVSAWYSYEFGLLYAEWGWPEGDPRELPACGVLGGETITPTGRVDTSGSSGFDISFEPCRRGHGVYTSRFGATYVQVRFLCNNRDACGGRQFILSRAVRTSRTGLPPPPPSCRVPRVIGLRLATAGTRIRRANCRVGRIRSARSKRIGRVIRQSPRPGVVRRQGYPVTLAVGRR